MYHALIFNVDNSYNKRQPGGHRIASFLREQDWDVEVIDWGDYFSLEELKEISRSRITNKTVFIGFSHFMSYWSDNLENYCLWLRKKYPDIKIVSGGQSIPWLHSNAIQYYVYGYGENAILELIKSFVNNISIDFIKFDSKFSDKKIINANQNYPSFPMPKLKIKYEERDFLKPNEWLTIELARGCIFKCLFCNYPILGVRGDYTRDAEDFYYEIMDNYDKWGIKHYWIADETFNDYSKKIQKFANISDKLPFKPYFSAFLRGDLIALRQEDWEPLCRLGVLGHFYGLETMNPDSMKAIGKGGNIEKIQKGLVDFKNYASAHSNDLYRGQISMIAGLPHETLQSLEKSFNWLKDNWQGHHTAISPLEIPLDDNKDRLSKLSLEYKKWGYRLDDENEKIYQIKGFNQINNKMNWINHNMSLIDALRECEKWTDYILGENSKFKLGVFNLNYMKEDNTDIRNVLKIEAKDFLNIHENYHQIYLNEKLEKYKQKKLSL